MTPLVSLAEVSKLLAVCKGTVRSLVHDGQLRCVRLKENGPMRFDLRDVEKFVESRKG
jgi:excisionase family DNA binding protein